MGFILALREIIAFVDGIIVKFRLLHKLPWSLRVVLSSLLNLYIYFVISQFKQLHDAYNNERKQYISHVAALRTSAAKRKLRNRRLCVEEYTFLLNEYKDQTTLKITSMINVDDIIHAPNYNESVLFDKVGMEKYLAKLCREEELVLRIETIFENEIQCL